MPSVNSVLKSFAKAAGQADDFVVEAVKQVDAHGAQLLDAALAQSPAKTALVPLAFSLKNASQAVVTTVEQMAGARKSRYRAQAPAA